MLCIFRCNFTDFSGIALIHHRRIKHRRDAELIIETDIAFLRLEVKRLVAFVVLEQISKRPIGTVPCATRRKLTSMNGDKAMERAHTAVCINHRDAIVIEHRNEHLTDKILFIQITERLRFKHGIRLNLHFLIVVKDDLTGIKIFVVIAIPGRIDKQANRTVDIPLDLREKPGPESIRVRLEIPIFQIIGELVFIQVEADKQMIANARRRM